MYQYIHSIHWIGESLENMSADSIIAYVWHCIVAWEIAVCTNSDDKTTNTCLFRYMSAMVLGLSRFRLRWRFCVELCTSAKLLWFVFFKFVFDVFHCQNWDISRDKFMCDRTHSSQIPATTRLSHIWANNRQKENSRRRSSTLRNHSPAYPTHWTVVQAVYIYLLKLYFLRYGCCTCQVKSI